MRRPFVAALTLLGALAQPPSASAANGSNYVHLLNGIDYYFAFPPPKELSGIFRCFPSEILHAPTRVVDPASPSVGEYATKIDRIHLNFTKSATKGAYEFPTIALTSGAGTCRFITTIGGPNFSLIQIGATAIVGGPVDAGTVFVQAVLTDVSIPSPSLLGVVDTLALGFDGMSALPIPDGHSLVLWVASDLTQSPADRQYWTGSADEKNLCSAYSFLLSGASIIRFQPEFEWAIGFSTRDAAFSSYVAATASNPSGQNAHYGFDPPFDSGSGSRTISVSAGEVLGFATYDGASPVGGTPRLVLANVWRVTEGEGAYCFYEADAPILTLPTGGPGGPALTHALPQVPRIVGKLDLFTAALLVSGSWVAATQHATMPGGLNVPWYPTPAGVSGASGATGGMTIPVPPDPRLVGRELFFSNVALTPGGDAIAAGLDSGHAHANGFSVRFFP